MVFWRGGEQSWSLCRVGFVVCVGMWRGDGVVVWWVCGVGSVSVISRGCDAIGKI